MENLGLLLKKRHPVLYIHCGNFLRIFFCGILHLSSLEGALCRQVLQSRAAYIPVISSTHQRLQVFSVLQCSPGVQFPPAPACILSCHEACRQLGCQPGDGAKTSHVDPGMKVLSSSVLCDVFSIQLVRVGRFLF